MIAPDLPARLRAAKAAGAAYLLVCYDSFDRLRGDADGGLYYRALDSAAAVRAALAQCQLGRWNPRDARDGCEAVIDLAAAGAAFSPDLCQDPAAWLARQPPEPPG